MLRVGFILLVPLARTPMPFHLSTFDIIGLRRVLVSWRSVVWFLILVFPLNLFPHGFGVAVFFLIRESGTSDRHGNFFDPRYCRRQSDPIHLIFCNLKRPRGDSTIDVCFDSSLVSASHTGKT